MQARLQGIPGGTIDYTMERDVERGHEIAV